MTFLLGLVALPCRGQPQSVIPARKAIVRDERRYEELQEADEFLEELMK